MNKLMIQRVFRLDKITFPFKHTVCGSDTLAVSETSNILSIRFIELSKSDEECSLFCEKSCSLFSVLSIVCFTSVLDIFPSVSDEIWLENRINRNTPKKSKEVIMLYFIKIDGKTFSIERKYQWFNILNTRHTIIGLVLALLVRVTMPCRCP